MVRFNPRLVDMNEYGTIAANRFGLGARPGEIETIGNDSRDWLLRQVPGPPRPYKEIAGSPPSSKILTEVLGIRQMQREERRNADDGKVEEKAKNYGRTVRQHYTSQVLARYQIATSTDYPFHERLVHFWSNHFAVSVEKQPLPAIAALYENEAIRPNVSGRFVDMLIAVETHPAMITYLDNQRSIGSASEIAIRAKGRRRRRGVGLNENLAREILELHTLGVDGGYTQSDVTTFAKVITGWSVSNSGKTAGRFEFRDAAHEPGTKSLLGRSYSQSGQTQGIAVLEDLASSEITARFLSTKLARHFVADQPPASLIDKLVDSYMSSDGELGKMYETLVLSDESWDPKRQKYKSPSDYLISSMRAFDHVPDNPRRLFNSLEFLGQSPFRPESPAGWPDTAEEWGGSDALMKRITWANSASNLVKRAANPAALGDDILGPAFASSESRKAITRAESTSQGITMLLTSPEFQRR